MNRRNFIQLSGTGLLAGPWLMANHPHIDLEHRSIAEMMREWISENDRILERQLNLQIDDPSHRFDGGISNDLGIPSVGAAAWLILRYVSAFISSSSIYYQDLSQLPSMERAGDFLLRSQHSDGTIDLLITNFHSPPDLGFVVEPVAIAYKLLDRTTEKSFDPLLKKLETFLKKGAEALKVGGIHTPNHRWVVCMALARIHELFPDPAYVKRIDTWLAEKIDIDPDGQYTEKSTLVYTPITNKALITVAQRVDRPKLWEAVRKNLEMSLYYRHPNGEIATETSTRQDNSSIGTMTRYYYAYRYMAIKDKNPLFSAACEAIAQGQDAAKLSRWFAYFLEDDSLKQDLPKASQLPINYVRSFSHSHLVRIRRENISATILGKRNVFFVLHHLHAVLQGIRLNASFFGEKGQFIPGEVMQTVTGWELFFRSKGPYYQPYSNNEIPGDGVWQNMPRSQRKQSEVQTLEYRVKITEVENGFHFDFEVTGTDHVPVAIELGFRKGGTLSGVRTVKGISDAFLLEEKTGTYQYGKQKIVFGPGKMEHHYTQLRGAPPKMNALSVYITGFSPFKYEMKLQAD